MTPENAIDRVCPNCQTTVHAVGQSPVRCPSCQTLIPAPASTADTLPNLSDLEHSADAPLGVPKPTSVADRPVPAEVDSQDAGVENESPLPAKAADLSGHDDVYGVVCRICDTRIHVRPEQVGQEIECPVCFSPVKVTAKIDKQKAWGRGGATYLEPAPRDPDAVENDDSGELRLAELDDTPTTPAAQLPPAADPAQPIATGVDDEDDDLPRLQPLEDPEPTPDPRPKLKAPPTTPRADTTSSQSAADPSPPDSDEEANHDPSESKPASKPSRRQKLAAAEFRRQQAEADQGFGRPASAELADDFPEFEIGALASAIGKMVGTPGVLLRAVAALLMMLIGVVIIAVLSQSGATETDPPMLEQLVTGLFQGIGLAVYLLGLFGLWFVCGTMFRDAASGLDRVRTWKVQGTSEMLGTFLLFAFSMFIAGLPMLFLSALILPLRILVGPLFLLAAWFNRSAWSILSVDVFQGTRKISGQWSTLYTMLVILAAAGLLSGGLLWMRGLTDILVIDLALSVVAVVLHVAVMLAFAPLAGWHVGLVMKHLERE